MIVVRVELHSAITRKITEIARFDIWNTGTGSADTGSAERGDYSCASFIGRDRESLAQRRENRTGSVPDHPRLREHVLNLVAKALLNMGYGKTRPVASRLMAPVRPRVAPARE
jgi:hypothetical protein